MTCQPACLKPSEKPPAPANRSIASGCDRVRARVLGLGPVGEVDAAVGPLPAVAGADRASRLERHTRSSSAGGGVGQVGGDEPELAVDQLDLARASARPRSISPRVKCPSCAARIRSSARIAHIRSIRSGSTRRLAVAGIAARCVAVCRFPHLKTSLVGEHGRGAGAGAGGCQRPGRAGQKHRTPAVPGRGDHLQAPKARAPRGPRPGACFCLTAGKPAPSSKVCSPTQEVPPAGRRKPGRCQSGCDPAVGADGDHQPEWRSS